MYLTLNLSQTNGHAPRIVKEDLKYIIFKNKELKQIKQHINIDHSLKLERRRKLLLQS